MQIFDTATLRKVMMKLSIEQLVIRLIALLALCQATLVSGATAPATLVDQGQRAFDVGNFDQAASNWQHAVNIYRKQGNTNSEVSSSLLLASAWQSLGQHRRAADLLEQTLTQATAIRDSSLVTRVKARLGAASLMTKQTEQADEMLHAALEGARAEGDRTFTATVLNDLGNLLVTQQKLPEALKSYEESAALAEQSGEATVAAQALCNAASAAVQAGQTDKAETFNKRALEAIGKFNDSHGRAFLALTVGLTDRRIASTNAEQANRLLLDAHNSFQQALGISERIGDSSIETYALGYLGALYEQDGQLDSALSLTRRAAFSAQEKQMPEALYRWEWQTGRLLRKQGDVDGAIASYRRAIQSLQSIRTDVSSGFGNSFERLSFRESEGPLFYELADMLLQQSKAAPNPQQEQQLLVEARDTVESLKSVELEDYFCDECVDLQRSKKQVVENVDKNSAVIYLIPLPDRTEVLVGQTSGLKRFTADVPASKLNEEVRQFRRNLESRTSYRYLQQSQDLYNWLIRPARSSLEDAHINTIVFVSDGALRTIPLAALNDGDHFLIQDFAVAVVPGLSLVEPKTLERKNVRLLLNGLSKSVQGFAQLDFVTNELHSIDQDYASETLLNEKFTRAELQRKLDEQFTIVHIASHGQFDKDVHKTFVLTYDNKLTLNDLETLIRPSQYRGRPVELLVLSACQTAAGDERAALGLAGIAIKAGARSALASLWFVNDQSTSALISEFYSQLRDNPSISKARAMQAAQVKLLNDRRYHHPCYWSPYLIIGNWL